MIRIIITICILFTLCSCSESNTRVMLDTTESRREQLLQVPYADKTGYIHRRMLIAHLKHGIQMNAYDKLVGMNMQDLTMYYDGRTANLEAFYVVIHKEHSSEGVTIYYNIKKLDVEKIEITPLLTRDEICERLKTFLQTGVGWRKGRERPMDSRHNPARELWPSMETIDAYSRSDIEIWASMNRRIFSYIITFTHEVPGNSVRFSFNAQTGLLYAFSTWSHLEME